MLLKNEKLIALLWFFFFAYIEDIVKAEKSEKKRK